ncbi:hypothetical protein RI367_007976 [Sorochytrium milnesiophthora]
MSRQRSSTVGGTVPTVVKSSLKLEDLDHRDAKDPSDDSVNSLENDEDEGGGLGLGGFSKLQRYGGLGDLNNMFASRPTKEELISKGILKDDKISPRLQAAQEELRKKKLESLLNTKLEHRSPLSELVQQNILKDPAVNPAEQAAHDAQRRQNLESALSKQLETRYTNSPGLGDIGLAPAGGSSDKAKASV